MQHSIKVTVFLDTSLWVALFEKNDESGLEVARQVFGKEPTDPELYEYILGHYQELKFSLPYDFKLVIKRVNPQRRMREVKKEMQKSRASAPKETYAQEVLREELELRKLNKQIINKAQKEAEAKERFRLEQEKKKKKRKGH